MTGKLKTISIFPLVLMASCLDPYYPDPQSNPEAGFLVIDGFLDGVKRTGVVKLSRSLLLGELRNSTAELNAEVTVETEDGSFSLEEKGNGNYEAADLDLDPVSDYILHVRTADGSTYTSDPINLRVSPEFDSLVWRAEPGGVRFYVNGHDENNNTKYWHYGFKETWEYEASMTSKYVMTADGYPVKRKPEEQVHNCWYTSGATQVLIQSTTRLSQDLVTMYPINFIPKGSRNFLIRYTILVEQRSISEDEYVFWDLIRRTTEKIGGLFDPIPSQVLGNVHSDDNSSAPVLGYFTGGFPREKRIFITLDDLPKDLQVVDRLDFVCNSHSVTYTGQGQQAGDVIIELASGSTYLVTSSICGDCRSLGGVNVKPSFWPEE